MKNSYKILRDDIEIIHLGKEDDGTLLSIERKYFDFLPEIGQKVAVFQGDGHYIVTKEDIENDLPINGETPRKSKLAAGFLALFLGHYGAHSLYLNNKYAFQRLLLGIITTAFIFNPLFNDSEYLKTADVIAFFCSVMYASVMSVYILIEAIFIFTSKKGSKWHKDGDGNELLD